MINRGNPQTLFPLSWARAAFLDSNRRRYLLFTVAALIPVSIHLPGRLLKEIPLLNNMRIPQRWVWPAQICLVLSRNLALSVLYTARMPFTVYELPLDWNKWTPPAADWLKLKHISMIVFPFHDGSLVEFRERINQAKKAVLSLIELNKHGQLQ